MKGVKKQFDFIGNSWEEVSYPSNIGVLFTGSDSLKRRIIMSDFKPDFISKTFDFDFQIWIESQNKEGILEWTFKEGFKLKANKSTWLGATGTEYLERLPVGDPLSAWEEEGILKKDCLITNFDYWHGQIFGTVEPVLIGSIISKEYCGLTSVS
jgi:hypothetical protein